MIEELDREQAVDESRNLLADGDPTDLVRERLDLVALRMIVRADQLRGSRPLDGEAEAIYRQVIRLFPTTHSAELARARLAEHESFDSPRGA
jgi:hypothetical protein